MVNVGEYTIGFVYGISYLPWKSTIHVGQDTIRLPVPWILYDRRNSTSRPQWCGSSAALRLGGFSRWLSFPRKFLLKDVWKMVGKWWWWWWWWWFVTKTTSVTEKNWFQAGHFCFNDPRKEVDYHLTCHLLKLFHTSPDPWPKIIQNHPKWSW